MRFRQTEDETLVEDAPAPVVEEEELGPPPPPPAPPRPLLWPWLLLLLLLVAGGLVAAWLLTRDNGKHSSGPSTVNVPNVVRLKQQDAVQRLNALGLVARIRTRASTVAPGTVVAQNPSPGANVTRHSVVTLAVSSAQNVDVPSVVGKQTPAAVSALRAKGLDVQTVNVSSKQPAGTVVAESPAAGASVGRGSTVTIRVSRGQAAVPDTLGQTRATAIAAIRGAGLVPKAFLVPSSQPKNTVVSQNPQAGKRIATGSTVRLNVSNGSSGSAVPPPPPPAAPATVDVPDVTGQLQDAAQKQLNTAGLKAGIVYVRSDQPQGTVVSQSPSGGTTAKRGTRVQLNVALGSQPGTLKGVPEVRNLDPATARSKLEAAGFKVQTLQQPVSDPAQVGKVVDEQPAGGRNAPAGSVITIYVGKKSA